MDSIKILRVLFHNSLMTIIIAAIVIIRNRHVFWNVPKSTVFGHMGIGVVIHENCKMGEHCMVAQNVTIGSRHGSVPVIGDGVILMANSVVLGDVSIGSNSVVAPGSVVLDSCEPYSFLAGNPAKLNKIITKDDYEKYKCVFIPCTGGIR